MRQAYRLKENRDFRRVFQRGKSAATARFVLYWWEKRSPSFRVGFSISKKVGNAVIRNRLKRKLRAWFHEHTHELEGCSVDFVVVCRKGSGDATYKDIETDFIKLLRRAKFMV